MRASLQTERGAAPESLGVAGTIGGPKSLSLGLSKATQVVDEAGASTTKISIKADKIYIKYMIKYMENINNIPIIVLNWNGWEDTFECLDALTKSIDRTSIWVVDNGSKENRSAELQETHPGIRIILLDNNYGWAGGYNRSLQIAVEEGNKFAFLLNNDAIVDRDFLLECKKSYRPGVAAVGSTILFSDHSVHFDGEYWRRSRKMPDTSGEVADSRISSVINGSAFLMDLDAFAECGGFNEEYFCYGEEHEWCRRVQSKGWSLLVSHGSRVTHDGGASDVSSNALYYMIRNSFIDDRELPLGARQINAARQVSVQVAAARLEKRQGDETRAFARLQAIEHGLTGRFGPRDPRPLRWWTRLLAQVWFFKPALLSRMRARLAPPSK